jgi:hypothetical protein
MQIEKTQVIVEDERAGQVHFGKVAEIIDVNEKKAVLNFKPGVDSVDFKFAGDLSELKKIAGFVIC